MHPHFSPTAQPSQSPETINPGQKFPTNYVKLAEKYSKGTDDRQVRDQTIPEGPGNESLLFLDD